MHYGNVVVVLHVALYYLDGLACPSKLIKSSQKPQAWYSGTSGVESIQTVDVFQLDEPSLVHNLEVTVIPVCMKTFSLKDDVKEMTRIRLLEI